MRISDWSSDVCSSDLDARVPFDHDPDGALAKKRAQPACRKLACVKVHDLLCCGLLKRHLLFRPRMVVPNSQSTRSRGRKAWHWGEDRKSVVSGKSVSVRVELGGGGIIKKKKQE